MKATDRSPDYLSLVRYHLAELVVVCNKLCEEAGLGSLALPSISKINRDRSRQWEGQRGNLSDKWNAADWANAMAGEAGELCNAVKKLRRLECGMQQSKGPKTREEALEAIAQEVGDTFLYLDLLCHYLGINLEKAICDTFNRVSEREGFPHRLGKPIK